MASNTGKKKSVLFICLGNICRSPIAEAVFQHLVKEKKVGENWKIDSAAIGSWHVGEQPEPRAFKALRANGIQNYSHVVRKIKPDDFKTFDFIFGMDNENIRALTQMTPKDFTGKVALLGSYDPQGELIIRDPYYDNDDKGFHKCYEQCRRSCAAFLEQETGNSSGDS